MSTAPSTDLHVTCPECGAIIPIPQKATAGARNSRLTWSARLRSVVASRRAPRLVIAIAGILLLSHAQVAGSVRPSGPRNPQPAATPGPPILAATDSFDRSVTSGWGTTADGGTWIVSDVSAFTVDGGVGAIDLEQGGVLKSAMLGNLQVPNVDITVRITHDKPAAAAQYVYIVARRSEPDREYRVKIRFARDDALFVQSLRLIDAKEEPLGQEVLVTGVNAPPGAYVRIHARVTGSNPTSIMVRAWADGAPEPSDWVATNTDATPVLQGTGLVGVRAYLAAKTPNAPVVVSVDDFSAK